MTAGISKIGNRKSCKRVKLNIYTAKPGMVIGRGGQGIEALKGGIKNIVSNDKNILINIVEVKSAETMLN